MPQLVSKLILRWRGEMKRCGKSRDERIGLLVKWAAIVARNDTPMAERRRAHHLSRRKPMHPVGQCWACSGWADLVDHHVIQIQNGGSNWHLNLVRICGECHVAIHPWLDMPSERTLYAKP